VDGTYTLTFAVTGCNTAGGTTPSADCLTDSSGTPENIPVTVTITSLYMGDLCTVAKTYGGSASALEIYADSTFTTSKANFIAADTNQNLMYIASTVTLADAPSTAAYTGFEITSVSRMCVGISTCTAAYVPFPSGDVDNLSPDPTHIQFSIPVADFTELTSSFSEIPYSIQLTAALLFTDNTKRTVIQNYELKRSPASSVVATSVGSVQFVAQTQSTTIGNTHEISSASQQSSSLMLLSAAAVCVGVAALA